MSDFEVYQTEYFSRYLCIGFDHVPIMCAHVFVSDL